MALFQKIMMDGRGQALVFFDVSGSTITNKYGDKHVIYAMADHMFTEMRSYNISSFKVAFFGSCNPKMPNGYIFDYSTYTTTSSTLFVEEAISYAVRFNLTCPHYALNGVMSDYKKGTKLLVDWMNPKDDVRRMVFIIGDGELFDGSVDKSIVKHAFKHSFDEFMKLFPLHTFVILTVDVTHASAATESAIVGSDMYHACGNTKRISRFKTFTKACPEGDVLFDNPTVPLTHIKFGNDMFLRTREPEFYEWVKTRSPDEMSHLIRYVCSALADYIEKEGMNDMMMESLVNSYKRILPTEYGEILQLQIQRVMSGTAALASEFRKSLAEKFASADEALVKDAQKAMGATGNCMTTLENGTIYLVKRREVTHLFTRFANGAAKIGDAILPVFPVTRIKNDMNDQCLRQYMRGIMSKYGYEAHDENSKWAVLCEMLCVIYTPSMTEELKTTWRHIGATMLQQKVAGKDITEMDYFREGNTSSTLKNGLHTVAMLFGISGDAAWSGICKQMGILHGDNIMWMNQNCIDVTEWSKLKKVSLVEFEELEWKCPVTFASTTEGGWTFPDHLWRGVACESRFVLSTEAVDGMNVHGEVKCLVCRTKMLRDAMTFRIKTKAAEVEPTLCRAIQMVGVPGSGKTFCVKSILVAIESSWTPHVISVDDECIRLMREGMNSREVIRTAITNTTAEVGRICRLPGKHILVVDTCGDFKEEKIFGHTVDKIIRVECNRCDDWDAYFGGSLFEVLTRTSAFLNVRDTGFQKCIEIHKKKSNSLWGGKYKLKPPYTSVDSAVEYLRPFHEKWKASWGKMDDFMSVFA